MTIVLLFLATLTGLAEEFSGKVVGVSDGDTIRVMRAGREVKIRLNGIDCPEGKQAFSTRAKHYTSENAFDQNVRVVVFGLDRYGRTVGDVYLPDGQLLNAELVRVGLAWWYRKYAPHNETLARFEQQARGQKAGLWADPAPIPPWEWRQVHAPAKTSPTAK